MLGNAHQWILNWEKVYKGDISNKKGMKDCWMKFPKLVYWHLWIEQNQRIFQNIVQPPGKIVTNTQALMGEVLKINQISRNKAKLIVNEIMWLHSFNYIASNFEPLSKKLETWEIRFDNSQFVNWMK